MCLQESPVLSGGQQTGVGLHFPARHIAHPYHMATESVCIDPAVFDPTVVTAPSRASGEASFIHPAVLAPPMASMGDSASAFTTQMSFPHPQPFLYDDDDDCQPRLSASTPRDLGPVVHTEVVASHESWKRDDSAFSEPTPEGLDESGTDPASTRQRRGVPDDALSPGMLRDPASNRSSNHSEIVNYLKRFPKELLRSALGCEEAQETEPESPLEDESNPRIQLQCPDPYCDKNFGRPCELK